MGFSNSINGKCWFNNSQRLLFIFSWPRRLVLSSSIILTSLFFSLMYADFRASLWVQCIPSVTKNFLPWVIALARDPTLYFAWVTARDNAGFFLYCIFDFNSSDLHSLISNHMQHVLFLTCIFMFIFSKWSPTTPPSWQILWDTRQERVIVAVPTFAHASRNFSFIKYFSKALQ